MRGMGTGCGLRVAGYGLRVARVTGCVSRFSGLRVALSGLRVALSGLRVIEYLRNSGHFKKTERSDTTNIQSSFFNLQFFPG